MALFNTTVLPSTPYPNVPYRIYQEWCMGDSLDVINANFNHFDATDIALQTKISSLSASLNALNTIVMNNLGSYPYARLYENLASANVSIGTTFQNRVYSGLEETSISFINNQGSGNFNFKSTGVYQCKIHLPCHLKDNLVYTSGLYYTTTVQFVEGTAVKFIKFTPMLDNMTNAGSASNTPLQHTTHHLTLEGTIKVTSTSTVYGVQQKASNTNTVLTSLGGQAEFWKIS
jgi:hypothetical protein